MSSPGFWSDETLEALARHVTAGSHCPRAAARAVFTWVATNIAYDVDAFLHQTRPLSGADTGWTALRRRKATCSGYTDLLQLMCRACGIECVKVQGFAKGAGFLPGRSFCPSSPNHEWNAVRLHGRWYLADVCWSAGYIRQPANVFVFQLTDHYFLTDPEVFVADHLPLDAAWQLRRGAGCGAAQTLERFETAVHRKQGCFQHGVCAVRPEAGVLRLERGEAAVTLTFRRPLALTYELRHLGTGREYSKCVHFKVGRGAAHFLVRPALLGAHTFKVYGKPRGCQQEPVALTTHTLHVHAVSPSRLPCTDLRFPWGPTRHLTELGLEEMAPSCSCLAPGESDAEYQVTFSCADPRVTLSPELYELRGGKVSRCGSAGTRTAVRSVRRGRALTVTAAPSSPGHYWLSVYASRLQHTRHPSKCVANFLICSFPELPKATPIPHVDTRWRHECGIQCESPERRGDSARPALGEVSHVPASGEQSLLRYLLHVEAAALGRLVQALVHACAKIKHQSQKSCVRFIQYMIG